MPRTREPYPPEFRQQMIELVKAGRSPEELSREFEVETDRAGEAPMPFWSETVRQVVVE